MKVQSLTLVFTPLLCALLCLTGCNRKTKATPENFQNALNRYYSDHPQCLFSPGLRFPYEVSNTEKNNPLAAQMDALTEATLLRRKVDRTLHVNRYTLTPLAERATTRFCYGHRLITAIDGSSTPVKQDGFLQTTVNYHYKLQDVPVWARTQAMQKAFSRLPVELNGQATGSTRLALTMTGWQVPE